MFALLLAAAVWVWAVRMRTNRQRNGPTTTLAAAAAPLQKAGTLRARRQGSLRTRQCPLRRRGRTRTRTRSTPPDRPRRVASMAGQRSRAAMSERSVHMPPLRPAGNTRTRVVAGAGEILQAAGTALYHHRARVPSSPARDRARAAGRERPPRAAAACPAPTSGASRRDRRAVVARAARESHQRRGTSRHRRAAQRCPPPPLERVG